MRDQILHRLNAIALKQSHRDQHHLDRIEDSNVETLDFPELGAYNDSLRIPGSEIENDIRAEDNLDRNVPSQGVM